MYTINCEVIGGLGNQLFILATGIALSIRFNRTLEVIWDELKYQYHFTNDYRSNLYTNYNVLTSTPLVKKIIEDQSQYTAIDLTNVNEDVILDGYFQSSKYFNDYRGEILSRLYMSPNDTQIISNTTECIRARSVNKNIIGLQVRRTDYNSLGWALPESYYTKAIKLFPESTFVITTDDIGWCKSNLPSNCLYLTEITNEYLPDYIQLYIMSKLDGVIISNSTFGWWIPYIGDLSKVVAPTPWFKNHTWNKNIYMDHWIKIDVSV